MAYNSTPRCIKLTSTSGSNNFYIAALDLPADSTTYPGPATSGTIFNGVLNYSVTLLPPTGYSGTFTTYLFIVRIDTQVATSITVTDGNGTTVTGTVQGDVNAPRNKPRDNNDYLCRGFQVTNSSSSTANYVILVGTLADIPSSDNPSPLLYEAGSDGDLIFGITSTVGNSPACTAIGTYPDLAGTNIFASVYIQDHEDKGCVYDSTTTTYNL